MGTSILRSVLFVAAAAATAIAVEPGAPPDAWVLFGPHESDQMSGSLHDLARAKKLAGEGPALFVRHGDHEWIIRDAKLMARAKTMMVPLNELGRQQGALGEKQGALGEKQGALGEKMSQLKPSGDSRRYEQQMETLAHQMDALGRQMETLGAQQEELGARMEQASQKMQAEMAALFEEARAANLAQPVK